MNWTTSHFFSLANTLALMNLKAEANRLYLSYLWWLIEPIIFAMMYYLVFGLLMKTGGEDFFSFLVCGQIMYLWFSKAVSQCSNSLISNRGLISSGAADLLVFPLSKSIEVAYKQLVVVVFLCCLVLLLGYKMSLNWLWLLPLLALQFLLILVAGYTGAILVVWARDFNTLIGLGLMLLLFISGVFWDIRDIEGEWAKEAIFIFNPLAFLLDAYRSVLLDGHNFSKRHLFLLLIIFGLLLFWLVRLIGQYRGRIANHLEGA